MKGLVVLIEIIFIVSITAFVFYKCVDLNSEDDHKLYRHVGDIEFDTLKDRADFTVCNEEKIFQYFNNGSGPQYMGGKEAIDEHFFSNYQSVEIFDESGWLRIRFVVNCEGEAGRYRVMASDFDYQEKRFDKRIVNQLLELTKKIGKWPQKKYRSLYGDYYMYLIFKIKDGQLIEVLP